MNNRPNLWVNHFPFPKAEHHKYDRGHVIVSGGNIESTGATCLAATAALRAGAGLVTVAAPTDSLIVYATKFSAVMAKPYKDSNGFSELISDPRKNVVLIGPGNGVNKATLEKTITALKMGKNCVLDADALTVFQNKGEVLFEQIKSHVVLTPHEGEFKMLFGDIKADKTERAVQASKLSNAIVVLKGNNTVIAAPDGRFVINHNAPPVLATAGSGDVLAGIIAALIAQKMETFLAACCAVWLHSKAAELFGFGLISEDLIDTLPLAMQALQNNNT